MIINVKAKSSAPAKIILFGEHFVVYGNPCILSSIKKRMQVNVSINNTDKIRILSDLGNSEYSVNDIFLSNEFVTDPIVKCISSVFSTRKKSLGLDITISSEFPVGMGLGSSAACCVATTAAIDSLFGEIKPEWICEQAIEAERIIHKNSSGADCVISTYGGIIYYSKGSGFDRIYLKQSFPILVIETGIIHSTRFMIEKFKRFRDNNLSLFNEFLLKSRLICNQAIEALTLGKLCEIGYLFNENHGLLKEAGVSHMLVDKLISYCLKSGVYGAKMTGAGGGGSVIAVADQLVIEQLHKSLYQMGFNSIISECDLNGLLITNDSNILR